VNKIFRPGTSAILLIKISICDVSSMGAADTIGLRNKGKLSKRPET
jgi:hypothetical protein